MANLHIFSPLSFPPPQPQPHTTLVSLSQDLFTMLSQESLFVTPSDSSEASSLQTSPPLQHLTIMLDLDSCLTVQISFGFRYFVFSCKKKNRSHLIYPTQIKFNFKHELRIKHPSASSVSSTSRRTYAPSLHVYVRPPTPQLSLSTDLSEHQSILSAGPESREPHSVHEKRRIKLRLLLCAALLTYQDFYASISNILDCIDTPGSNETRPQLTKLALIISAMAHEIRILAQFVLDGNIPRLSGFWPRAWIILLKLDILSESIRDVIDQLTTDGRRHHQHQKRLRFFHPNDLLVGCQLFFFEREVKVAMKSSFSTLSGLRSLNVFAMDQRQRPFPPATCSQPTRVYDWIRGLGAQDSGYL
ncbi:hypothetical protein B0A52_00032 [Exophiala mesophila]|uniref:Uncharacterized protein n=1 Tax=Exophiala mesophila TaxID=212818 RepID=A0A438NIW6_EXOME|nr:hypothetical protein B0A52_00032 [Exophiala mesophila]